MKRAKSMLWFLMVPALIGSIAAQAPTPPPVYSLIGLWEVTGSDAKLFEDNFSKYQKPILDKFVADGTIVEYGFETSALHTPEGYTHTRWITAESRANLEKAISTIVAAFDKMPVEQRTKMDKDYDRMIKKHRDYLTSTAGYRNKPGQYTKGYAMESFFQAKPGKMRELQALWDKYNKPIFDQLLNDGVLLSYGVDTELFHTEQPGGIFVWYVTPDMAAEDKIDKAFDDARAKLSQEERDNFSKTMRELTETEKHRDSLSVIRFYSSRAYQPTS